MEFQLVTSCEDVLRTLWHRTQSLTTSPADGGGGGEGGGGGVTAHEVLYCGLYLCRHSQCV